MPVVGGLIAAAVAIAGLVVFVGRGSGESGESEFEQRRAQAEQLEERAASAENWAVGVSPQGWAREEWTVDRASRSVALHRWQGDGEPNFDAAPFMSLLFIGDSQFIRSPRFDDASSYEPTWYLNEDADGMEPAVFESYIASPWSILDDYTADVPEPAGSEDIDQEQLDRFDLFIPASAFDEGMLMTIGGVGLIDPSNGVQVSFWFANDGALRRFTAAGEGDTGSSTYEYRSQVSSDTTAIDAPDAPRSWNEFKALQD